LERAIKRKERKKRKGKKDDKLEGKGCKEE
jgi:hypothetical protein